MTRKKAKNTSNKKFLMQGKVEKLRDPKNKKVIILLIFVVGTLCIFATYAWFSVNLNVKIRTFRMVVDKNSGLEISFDAINYSNELTISQDIIINELTSTYPNHTSQWANRGLIPVSSPGLPNNNTYYYDFYASNGVVYKNAKREVGYVETLKEHPVDGARPRNYYIAFDIFIRNNSGSPVADNLYYSPDTGIVFASDSSEQMEGLLNSTRIGLVRVADASIDTDPTVIQNLQCNNGCQSIIFEPYSTVHTALSQERALKFGVNLVDGEYFPTYAFVKEVERSKLMDSVSGSPTMNYSNFKRMETIKESDFNNALFQVPYGVTKARVYIWIEGQDIDSLETDSEGADVDITISFHKDTFGYEYYG